MGLPTVRPTRPFTVSGCDRARSRSFREHASSARDSRVWHVSKASKVGRRRLQAIGKAQMPFAGDLELIANDIKRQSNLLRDARSWSRESSRSTAAKTPPANRVYLVGCG